MVMATLEQQSTTCGNAGLAWTCDPESWWNVPRCSRVHVGDVRTENHENETAVAFTARPRLVLDRLQTEGIHLPSEARGFIFVAWMPTRELGSKQRSCL